MSFLPPGTDPGELPAPFSHAVTNGRLQLLKSGVVVAEQDEFGSWFASTVMTGTNSYELGEILGMGACGENVAWVNSMSKTAYFPVWCAVSTDGTTVYDTTARVHGPLSTSEAAGAPHASITGPYAGTVTASVNTCFFKADIIPAESYTGKLKWLCEFVGTPNMEIAEFSIDVVLVAGVTYQLQFKYPLWIKTGQTIKTQLLKESGDNLLSKYGATLTTQPYRKTYYRTFTDQVISGIPTGTMIDWAGGRYGLSTPDGYWPCDGSTVNYPSSVLHGKVTDDWRGYVSAGAQPANADGSTAGVDLYTLARSNLPNINLSGSTSYTPSGSNAEKIFGTYHYAALSSEVFTNPQPGSSGGRPVVASYNISSISMNHNHPFTGTAATISLSNISLNGGVGQTQIDTRQNTRYVTKLIKL